MIYPRDLRRPYVSTLGFIGSSSGRSERQQEARAKAGKSYILVITHILRNRERSSA
jgi:hypothetical protein